MKNLNQDLESKNHELWTDNESRHDTFWPLAMTSIVGVGTLRQNPQLASIFRSKKGGSAIDNKQLWPIWMTEACDKEAANMQAIFTSSQTWTMSNSVNSVNSANSECKQIIVRCYLHLWQSGTFGGSNILEPGSNILEPQNFIFNILENTLFPES